ncbi:hypothetical protein HYX06_01500 [Candidatus Woesearchaeota archaeon]|nr:hypothetical protein [Candidatus Woesearchaeota archaeon]
MVYKGIRNSYSISDMVYGGPIKHTKVASDRRGTKTLEDYLPILRNLERDNGKIYYVRDGPDNTKVFGIEGRATLFMVPDFLYQEMRREVPSVQYGIRVTLKTLMKTYRRMKRQKKK